MEEVELHQLEFLGCHPQMFHNMFVMQQTWAKDKQWSFFFLDDFFINQQNISDVLITCSVGFIPKNI